MNVDKKSPARSGALTRRALLGTMAALPLVGHGGFAWAQAADALSVRVDFAPWGVHAALHLAQAKGWLKEDGLTVDIQDGTGTLSTINLVAAGKVDVGFVQLGPMAIARASGLPVKSFAGYLRKGDLAVMVDAAKGPKTAKELAGKKIVCFAASPWAPFVDQYIKNLGLEKGSGPGQVNVVMVSPAAMVATYASSDADGFMSLQEFGEPLVMSARPARSFLAADVGIAFPSYGLIATDESLTKRADALKRLSANQTRAWTYIYEKPAHLDEAVAAMMAQRADKQLNPEVLKAQLVLSKDFLGTPNTAGKPMGWQAAADWKLAVKSMSDAGLIKGDAKIEDYFTNDFIKS
ncbi:NitT/TauT family transport system substrate-binding protein [Nitrobacteraceae bacterium AZCC 2161]